MNSKPLLLKLALLALMPSCSKDNTTPAVANSKSVNPSGFSFIQSCSWKYIGTDSGTEENCQEQFFEEKLTSSDKERIKTTAAAKCLSGSTANKVSSSRCVISETKTVVCEGKLSQETGNFEDSAIFLRTVFHWPEANGASLRQMGERAKSSIYSCSLSKDFK